MRLTKDQRLNDWLYLLDKYVMDTSVSDIGSGGQRHQRTPEQLRDVAASLLVDIQTVAITHVLAMHTLVCHWMQGMS